MKSKPNFMEKRKNHALFSAFLKILFLRGLSKFEKRVK